ncbi:MAG: ABC transporter permease [Acetatifactor sp.]|nr:ABC transporter permease [Acetatifactor sp.]
MKITAKLALSQIKINKKRTYGAILAIAIATSLITAVSCFAASGNNMLVNFLGADYGNYSGAYRLIILIPALILGMFIFFMSFTVISDIFDISANQRMSELGTLKCVGGTAKQIRETVLYESVWLSLAGIPVGLVIGMLLAFLGVKAAGLYIEQINELSESIIMRPGVFRLEFSVSYIALVISALFSFATVYISAHKPAAKVGKIPALFCIKLTDPVKIDEAKIKDNKLWKTLFGFEGVLGDRNVKRNKSVYKPTIRALSLGIMLILMTAGIAAQARDIKNWMKSEQNRMTVDYCSLREDVVQQKNGQRWQHILHPIVCETYNEINQKLDAYGEFEVYGIGSDKDTYRAIPDKNFYTGDMSKVANRYSESGWMEFEVVSLTEELYDKICEIADVPYGSNILINYFSYNDNGEEKAIIPYMEEMEKVVLTNSEGMNTILPIEGYLYKEDFEVWPFAAVHTPPMMVIVPDASARYFDWYCLPEDDEDFNEYARAVLDEYYPLLTEDPYVEQGYIVRISREDTMSKMLNVAIVLAEVILYGFVILLATVGFVGFISTITSNIRLRNREFAVLKSVGMTGAALRKMLFSESILCTLKASVGGVLGGIALPFLVNLSIRKVFPVKYIVPWYVLMGSILAVLGIVLLITYFEIVKLKRQNIIEAIRME